MLSSKLKTDIRTLWNRFWSGGIANPLTAIEQITYLVFLKQLDDLDDQRARQAQEKGESYKSAIFAPPPDNESEQSSSMSGTEAQQATSEEKKSKKEEIDYELFRWKNIKEMPAEVCLNHMRGKVFDWLKTIPGAQDRMRDAVFVIPSPNLLQNAIDVIDKLFVPSRNQDTLGDIYEMLLSEIAESGKNGQFRTPRHIIRLMCDLVDPRIGDKICDPACGTAGFLVNAYQHILKANTSPDILEFEADGSPLFAIGDKLTEEQHKKLRQNHFYGFDFDRTMVRLGWMNMIQHGMLEPQINYADTLGSRFNSHLLANGGGIGDFDVILANPPFRGSIDKDDIGGTLKNLDTNSTELLFVELILQLLRVGGRAAVIVPEGLLFGSTKAHKLLRKKMVSENQLNAVISLPGGVFQPYASVKTSILFFVRGGQTEKVWFYEVGADGLSLSAKRTEQFSKNDLWDLTLKTRLRFAAAYPQPIPAFIDGDTWRVWQQHDEVERSLHYLQPKFAQQQETDSEGDSVTLSVISELLMQKMLISKDWIADVDTLKGLDGATEYNLSAGRYKPFALETKNYDPPSQIIRELQELEGKIQIGLSELLTMVEN